MQKVSDYPILKDISKITVEESPSFSGIVTRECKGNLWVDEIIHPQIALAHSYAVDSFAFLGECHDRNVLHKLKAFLDDTLFLELKETGNDYFEFSIESEQLREHILSMWADKEMYSEQEHSFRIEPFDKINQSEENLLPDGYQLIEVNNVFWKQQMGGKYENPTFLTTRLLESWYSFDDFIEHSLGYCVVFENRIVGVILGTASYHSVVPIDIETEDTHRKKGIAYALSIRFIRGCMERNLIPQWDCVESNIASNHLARKIGFQEFRANTVYWFQI